MPLTILSTASDRRAIVSATGDGAAVAYYRVTYDNEGRPSWRYQRTAALPQPFHVALDIACAIIETA